MLLKLQQDVFNDPARFKVVCAGRRCGKSRVAAWTMLIKALSTPKVKVFYVAPTQGQSRDILLGLLSDLAPPVITNKHVNNMDITLVNGSTIHLKGADRPDTLRVVSLEYLVLDEFAEMKPQVFDAILRPALTDRQGSCIFIATHKGKNTLYELY